MTEAIKEGAFKTGIYSNLFLEAGYSQEEIDSRLQDTWTKLFEDGDATRIYYEAGDDMGYLLDTGNLDVRTEGMSYGMMMAVQMDRQDVFDRIWRWSYEYMHMKDGWGEGYFAWSCNTDGSRRSDGPAPDGEEYFALALFFAAHRWGEGRHPLDYSAKARDILRACLHKGEGGRAGDSMWNLDNKLIKFIPNCDYSDPSYHLPHFYELFALWADPEDRSFWREAAVASRDYIHLSSHPATGLTPEYAHYDGTPNDERGFGKFYSDSYRVAGNIGLDSQWFRADPGQAGLADRIQAFFSGQSPSDYRRYEIDGTPLEEKCLHPVGLVATNAMASLATTGEQSLETVRQFWATPVRTGERRYYDNCLYMFAMLALSGNYVIWMPEGSHQAAQ